MVRRITALLVAAAFAYPAVLAFQIWEQSHDDEVRAADAIVVLGAAQYNGTPSPVFEARLDQGAYLFETDVSDTIIVTGGKQPGDRFTEAEAGESYLVEDQGIPPERILVENQGHTTLESLTEVAALARERDINSVLLVSDPLHSRRIKTIALDLGFEHAYTSPASYVELNRSRMTKARELLHEVGSMLAYQVLGR